MICFQTTKKLGAGNLLVMVAKLTGLSFIIPVLNEQEAIISTIENLGSQLSTLAVPYEIIVVDDGSTDDTA